MLTAWTVDVAADKDTSEHHRFVVTNVSVLVIANGVILA